MAFLCVTLSLSVFPQWRKPSWMDPKVRPGILEIERSRSRERLAVMWHRCWSRVWANYMQQPWMERIWHLYLNHVLMLRCFISFVSSLSPQQRSSTLMWRWRYKMWRAQPLLSGATCPAGSKTSCCESFNIFRLNSPLFSFCTSLAVSSAFILFIYSPLQLLECFFFFSSLVFYQLLFSLLHPKCPLSLYCFT